VRKPISSKNRVNGGEGERKPILLKKDRFQQGFAAVIVQNTGGKKKNAGKTMERAGGVERGKRGDNKNREPIKAKTSHRCPLRE